ncbi:HEAT repeat domain-containing protein [Streptomyces sp. NPDC012888]|uniref:HEAT repeat domain-containing protein n=1 Tax=Streptomyces sp. NPDC012888 TaxID=3364855 RepID=UPI0036A251B6
MKWLDAAVADGTATAAAHPSRIALFDAVRADPDRTGPVARRLLRLAGHPGEPSVRRAAMDLLRSLSGERHWPAALDVALTRLADPDEEVRRTAAHLVGRRGEPGLLLAVLGDLSDPVVRTVLAGALGPAVARLGSDRLAAVRFLAHLENLRTAPPVRWPALDTALLSDAREAALHLEDLACRWGRVLYGLGRERHAYALVARLLADPATRGLGAGLARTACHAWRAAPVALLPLLVRYGGGRDTDPGLADALRTALLSAEARRTHAALLTRLPYGSPAPGPRPRRCPCADPPAYDSGSAAALLAAKPVGIGRLRHATAVFGALLDAGPLTFRQAAQLYNLTFRHPGTVQAECAPLWLRHAGPAALPRLLALMTPRVAEYTVGEAYLAGLARMGRHAMPALPAVGAVIDRRTRIPVNDSTRDAETEVDERLLAAALRARRAILAGPSPVAGVR